MGTIDTGIWGQPIADFSGYNLRTGASSISDPDFENYPPFTLSQIDSNKTFANGCYSFKAGMELAEPVFVLDRKIDLSPSYVGIDAPDCFICQIGVIGNTADSVAYDETNVGLLFKSDNSEYLPLVFSNYRYFRSSMTQNNNAIIYNPYRVSSQGSFTNGRYFWKPNATDSTSAASSNRNKYMAYWRSLPLRGLIGCICVKYINSWDENSGIPSSISSETSLYQYEQNTAEWKAAHPIIIAYLKIYVRRSTAGLYDTPATGDSVIPDFSYGLKATENVGSVDADKMNIICPASWTGNSLNVMNFIPLFGTPSPINDTNGYVQFGTNADGGLTSSNLATLFGAVDRQGQPQYKRGINYDGTSGHRIYARSVWVELVGDAAGCEKLRRTAACYGLFFTDGKPDDTGYANIYAEGNDDYRWIDNKLCLGTVDTEGLTHGDYTRGLSNPTSPNFYWDDTTQSPYDPKKPKIPTNTYDTQTVFNEIGDLATMTKRYVITATEVEKLGRELWTITQDLITVGGNIDYTNLNEKLLDSFLTNNPIDCIVSLQRFPMEIPKAASSERIRLGKHETTISGYPMEKTAFTYLFQGTPINPKFADSFLDYEPYTKLELYIPFCGTIRMNPADIIGRDLNVQLVVDFTTGTATGFIMSGNLVIETVNGNIAIDIPVTGLQQSTVASQLYNAIANKSNADKQEAITGWNRVSLSGAAEMIYGDMLGGSDTFGIKGKKTLQREAAAIERERADYDLTHQNAPVHIIGSASAVGGWAIDLNCRLIIYYPSGDVIITGQPPKWNDLQLERFGKTIGFACCIESAIGDLGSGLVVGTSPDLSGMVTNTQGYAATVSELDMLRNAISEGVII